MQILASRKFEPRRTAAVVDRVTPGRGHRVVEARGARRGGRLRRAAGVRVLHAVRARPGAGGRLEFSGCARATGFRVASVTVCDNFWKPKQRITWQGTSVHVQVHVLTIVYRVTGHINPYLCSNSGVWSAITYL